MKESNFKDEEIKRLILTRKISADKEIKLKEKN